MIRSILIIGAMALGFSTTSALAQSEVLPSTKLMKEQGQSLYRDINGMVKGEAPFDKAKVDKAFADLKATSTRIAAAFPVSSKGKVSPDTRYSASPKVWEQPAEFTAAIAKLEKAVADNSTKAATLDALKAVYPEVSGACNNCHDAYRLRKE